MDHSLGTLDTRQLDDDDLHDDDDLENEEDRRQEVSFHEPGKGVFVFMQTIPCEQ